MLCSFFFFSFGLLCYSLMTYLQSLPNSCRFKKSKFHDVNDGKRKIEFHKEHKGKGLASAAPWYQDEDFFLQLD